MVVLLSLPAQRHYSSTHLLANKLKTSCFAVYFESSHQGRKNVGFEHEEQNATS